MDEKELLELPPLDPQLALKSLDGEGRIGGYLVVWGNAKVKDLQGEYFTPETDLALDWYNKRPVLYHHGLDSTIKGEVVGVIDTLRTDDVGLWAEAQLDLRKRYVQMVQKLVQQGVIGWSSGSLPHLVEVARDGQIKRWPIVEGSLTPSPAEPRRTNVSTIKSAFTELELDLSKLEVSEDELEEVTPRQEVEAKSEPLGEPEAKEADEAEAADGDNALKNQSIEEINTLSESEIKDMKVKELLRLLVDSVAAEMGAELSDEQRANVMKSVADKDATFAADADATDANVEAAKSATFIGEIAGFVRTTMGQSQGVQDAVKSAFAKPNPQSMIQGGHSGADNPQIEVRSKYHDLSAQDMAYLHFIRNGRRDTKWKGDEPFYREMADKAQKAYNKGEFKVDGEQKGLKSLLAIKTNDLNQSTLASGGDEWVPDLWSADLWERMRLDNVVAPRLNVVEMPSNPFELPIESTDPSVYFVPETADEASLTLASSSNPIPDSKMSTGKVQISAKKLGLRVGFSAEVEEDSIIPFIPQLRKQSMRAIEDAIDNVILNGDTATTLNINSDGETISDTTRKYLAFNGLIKLPIVTATTYGVNASGANPTLTMMRSVRAKLLNAYAADLRNLMWVVDFSTYMKLLAIDEVNTAANRGTTPTSATGILGGIDGVDIFVSNEMALADSDGKVTQTANVVDRGRALLVYRPAWYVGYRRRISTALDFLAYYDSYQLTVTVRFGLINRDNTCTAILYNIGV